MIKFTVSELTKYIKNMLSNDLFLSDAAVEGEVCAFRQPSSNGHLYFDLKDRDALLHCVCFSVLKRFGEIPFREGDHITVTGSMDVYASRYQLKVKDIEVSGEGKLYAEFLRLKAKLEREGLFEICKRTLPRYPKTIGVITSPVGAALQDVLSVVHSRFPGLHICLAPSLMQGTDAVSNILQCFDLLDAREDVELILLTRGGGSYEDLSLFNDERIARRIVRTKKPVVSAIGHETDFVISDLAADFRAATPTAAAERITRDICELALNRKIFAHRLRQHMEYCFKSLRASLLHHRRFLKQLHPAVRFSREQKQVNTFKEQLRYLMERSMAKKRLEHAAFAKRLESFHYEDWLKKGFSITMRENGEMISRAQDVSQGEHILTYFYDGKIHSIVNGRE